MEDAEIIELYFARSQEAVGETAKKYGALCGRVAGNILGDRRDVEETLDDTWLAVWNAIPPSRPEPLLAYLARLTRNIAVTRFHRNTAKKRNSFYDAALDELSECLAAPGGAEDALEASELTRILDAFLDGLKSGERVLFVRRYWYGDAVETLAKRFGITRGAASVRLARLRERLRMQLEKEGYIL